MIAIVYRIMEKNPCTLSFRLSNELYESWHRIAEKQFGGSSPDLFRALVKSFVTVCEESKAGSQFSGVDLERLSRVMRLLNIATEWGIKINLAEFDDAEAVRVLLRRALETMEERE